MKASSNLRVGECEFDADLVVFDKDGTLIEFTRLWHGIALRAIETTLAHAGVDSLHPSALQRALGFDPGLGTTDADGALAVGPNSRIYQAVCDCLCAHGMAKNTARKLVDRYFRPTMEALPTDTDIVACANVHQLFQSLKARNIRIAVATTDESNPTTAALAILGVLHLVDEILCADHPSYSTKPAKQALVELAQRHDVRIERVMMVGDTVADLRMARLAEAGLAVGVLSGAGTGAALEPWADVVTADIGHIHVL